MRHLLDAPILLAPTVCAAVSVPPIALRSPVSSDCPVAARSAVGTARNGQDQGRGYAGSEAGPAAGSVAAGL